MFALLFILALASANPASAYERRPLSLGMAQGGGHAFSNIMPSLGVRAGYELQPWLEGGFSFQATMKRIYLQGDSTLGLVSLSPMREHNVRTSPSRRNTPR